MIIDNAGTYTLRYTATDDCGKTTTVDRELVVADSVYGVEWDGSTTSKWTRTDLSESFSDPTPAVNNGTGSSPFDNISPWSEMETVNYTRNAHSVGSVVKIPKYWYKWTRNGTSMKLQISPEQKEGYLVSPAHADRGDGVGERDVVYVGRYHCTSASYNSSSGTPANHATRKRFREQIRNYNSSTPEVWQYDFAMYWTIAMLYLVEFADWNSQATIGYGCSSAGALEAQGLTDAMQYHTGTNAVSRDTYGQVQYRHIEGLWSNMFDYVDGIYFDGADVYVINNPANFSDTENGVKIGTRSTDGGVAKTFTNPPTGYEYALFPETSESGLANRTCDSYVYAANGQVLYVGGRGKQLQNFGLFCMRGDLQASSYSPDSDIGCRLQVLP